VCFASLGGDSDICVSRSVEMNETTKLSDEDIKCQVDDPTLKDSPFVSLL